MLLEQITHFIQDNWEMIGVGVVFLLTPSPATGLYRKLANKIGIKIGEKNIDSVIQLLDEIKAGLLESKVGDRQDITSNSQIEDIFDNAKDKLNDGGNVK